MSNEKTIHFGGLNALRFFSAFAIIVYHCSLNIQDGLPSALKMLFHNLTLGVDMFFLISGFLIVYLLLSEKEESHKISLAKFYIRRILRIFPLYFLIIGIAWLQYRESIPPIVYHRSLYFATNFWMISANSWTMGILNPLWSLCIEEHFYLVIPVLVLFIPLRRIHLLFWFVILVSIGFRLYATLTIQYNWFTIYLHTLSRCDVLAIGGLLAYYRRFYDFSARFSSLVLGCLFTYLILLMSIVDSSDYTTITFSVLKKYLFIAPMFLFFIGFILNKNEENKIISWLKSKRLIDYFGKISFGLYMFHTPVLEYLIPYHFINDFFIVKLISVSILTVLVSSISYELFEKKILRLKTKFEIIKSA
ncbi:MAG: acyltransferase [Saprospiraceae bacterium]